MLDKGVHADILLCLIMPRFCPSAVKWRRGRREGLQALFLELVVDGCVVHERLRERVCTTDVPSLMKERWRDTKEEKEREKAQAKKN